MRVSGREPVIGMTMPGIGAVGDHRLERRGIDVDLAGRSAAPASVGSCASRATARSQAAPCGARGAFFEIGVGGLVGRDHAGARAGFDGHVADGHALVHVERANGLAAILDDVAGAAADADLADDGEDQVLGGDARAQLAGRR